MKTQRLSLLRAAVTAAATLLAGAGLTQSASAQISPPLDITASQPIYNSDGVTPLPGSNPFAANFGYSVVAGCVVQIIDAGANGTADRPDHYGNPTGDDTIVATTTIGAGIAPNVTLSGRFSTSVYPPPASGSRLYARVFNAATPAAATAYGQSSLFTVSGVNVFEVSSLIPSTTNQLPALDTTPPVLGALTAAQSASNVLNCASTAQLGVVNISVQASDAVSMSNPPVVALTNGAANAAALFASQSPTGTYNYTWTLTGSTASGTWAGTVKATDDQGNTAVTNFTICADVSYQIGGSVQLQAFAGAARAVVFKVTDASGALLKTWTNTLSFTAGVAPYSLTGVPVNTAAVSAKTAWNLRRKLPATFSSGAATVNFTSSSWLMGADFSGDNQVNGDDYSIILLNWLSNTPNNPADVTGDGIVNGDDYSVILLNWLQTGDAE